MWELPGPDGAGLRSEDPGQAQGDQHCEDLSTFLLRLFTRTYLFNECKDALLPAKHYVSVKQQFSFISFPSFH